MPVHLRRGPVTSSVTASKSVLSVGQAGSLRRVGNPPLRRLAAAQVAEVPHKGTSSTGPGTSPLGTPPSWKETAQAFRTSWDKVFAAVEHIVTWGLEHRLLGQIE